MIYGRNGKRLGLRAVVEMECVADSWGVFRREDRGHCRQLPQRGSLLIPVFLDRCASSIHPLLSLDEWYRFGSEPAVQKTPTGLGNFWPEP